MDSLASIKSKLSPLLIYNLDNGTLISAELSVYAQEIDNLYDILEELERECFIDTAQSYGLSLRERLYGSVRSDLALNERREMLNYRYSITSNDFNKESIIRALIATGIRAMVLEMPGQNRLYINCLELFDTMVTNTMAEESARKFMPAHLECEFDFRPLQWTYVDDKDLTFAQIDAEDMLWSAIDSYE